MKKITILFPSVFGELFSPWDVEYKIAKDLGFNVAKIDENDFIISGDLSDSLVVYRGWMLSFDSYTRMFDLIFKKNGTPFISKDIFRKTNSFSAWYFRLSKYTMKSFFIKDDKDMIDKTYSIFEENESFFVKDNLKSLGEGKSIANSAEEALLIYDEIKTNRDFLIQDNGVCLREITKLEKEQRFFIINGKILDIGINYSKRRLKMVEKISSVLLEKTGIYSCSIDIATSNNKEILVEVGGFQVSDIDKSGDSLVITSFYRSLLNELLPLLDKVS